MEDAKKDAQVEKVLETVMPPEPKPSDAAEALGILTGVLQDVAATNKAVLEKLNTLTAPAVKTPAAKKQKVEATPEQVAAKEAAQNAREEEYARLKLENEKAGRSMLNARYYCKPSDGTSCNFHTYNGPDSMKDGVVNNPWVKHLGKNATHVMMKV